MFGSEEKKVVNHSFVLSNFDCVILSSAKSFRKVENSKQTLMYMCKQKKTQEEFFVI